MSCNPLIEENKRERERERERETDRHVDGYIERYSMYHTGCMNKLLLLFITFAKTLWMQMGLISCMKGSKGLNILSQKTCIVYKRIKDKNHEIVYGLRFNMVVSCQIKFNLYSNS